MYILMIARGYPTKEFPQWGCFEQDQAEALCNSGHQVVVLSVDSRFLWRIRKIGVTHYYKNGVNYYNSFWIPGIVTNYISRRLNYFFKKKQIKLLYKLVQEKYGKPDIIYGQFFFNTVMGVYLQKKYNIPLVGIEHAARFNLDKLDAYTHYWGSYAYSNADGIITVSQSLKQRILYHFNKQSTTINNLVHPIFFQQTLLPQQNADFHFVSTGSLVYRKGFDLLIKAFAEFCKNRNNAYLTIIGEGEERENLWKLSDMLGITEKVRLIGQKNKTEIAQILSCSSVFVLPSRSENFSVAVLEALAIGLPVIATLCGGIQECVCVKNGILIPVEDVESLSEAMKKIYCNIDRYNRQDISKDCFERFSPSVIADKLVTVFNEVIENRSTACNN